MSAKKTRLGSGTIILRVSNVTVALRREFPAKMAARSSRAFACSSRYSDRLPSVNIAEPPLRATQRLSGCDFWISRFFHKKHGKSMFWIPGIKIKFDFFGIFYI